jgi:hypothetical protein
MKKLLFIVLSLFLFSCKDVKDTINEYPDPFNGSNEITAIDTMHLYDKFLKIDTLVFDKLKKQKIADKVLAVTLEKSFSKDSIEINSCRLDFFLKNKLIQSIPINTYASSEDPMWSLYEDFFTNIKSKKSDHRFFEISYGVAACGFVQSNFLFFVANNEFQLVCKSDSVVDGPYGDGLVFEPYFVGDEVLYFSSKRVVVDSDESKPFNDEDENLVIVFSDSTIYKLNHGKWSGEVKTTVGKAYRKEYKTFNQLYKPE